MPAIFSLEHARGAWMEGSFAFSGQHALLFFWQPTRKVWLQEKHDVTSHHFNLWHGCRSNRAIIYDVITNVLCLVSAMWSATRNRIYIICFAVMHGWRFWSVFVLLSMHPSYVQAKHHSFAKLSLRKSAFDTFWTPEHFLALLNTFEHFWTRFDTFQYLLTPLKMAFLEFVQGSTEG